MLGAGSGCSTSAAPEALASVPKPLRSQSRLLLSEHSVSGLSESYASQGLQIWDEMAIIVRVRSLNFTKPDKPRYERNRLPFHIRPTHGSSGKRQVLTHGKLTFACSSSKLIAIFRNTFEVKVYHNWLYVGENMAT